MNEIVSKFLLAENKLILKVYLMQSGFTYSACWPFTQNKERIKKKFKNRRFTIYLSKWTR